MLDWHWASFQQLSTKQLFDIYKLRQTVFIIEQQSLYPDIDDNDLIAQHLLVYNNAELHAYLRIFSHNDTMVIGRIVVAKKARGAGLGRELIERVMQYLKLHYPGRDIIMSAQVQLTQFYAGFGFVAEGEAYDEDGIMHITMRAVHH